MQAHVNFPSSDSGDIITKKKNTVKFIMGLDIICIDGIEYVSLLALGSTSQWKIASGKKMTFLLQC